MSAKKRRHRKVSCSSKINTFRGRAEAEASARQYESARFTVASMSAYLCNYGDHWHIGHDWPRPVLDEWWTQYRRTKETKETVDEL